MRRFLTITKAMTLMQLRNRMTLFWNLFFPVFLLVIYAMIWGRDEVDGINYMTWVVPGVLALNILAYGLMSSSTAMVDMREKGVLRRLQATPVPAGLLLGAYVVVNVLVCLAQAALIIIVSVTVFGLTLPAGAVTRLMVMLPLAVIISVALGQLVSGVATRAGVAVAVGQILYFSQMFVSDMIMPIEMMPDWVQKAAVYLPGHTIVQLIRPAVVDGAWAPDLSLQLALAAGYILLAGAVAAMLFRWAPRS
jgi:ABC-2 type transport system permease protein